ncbi:unnamed protein product, partial [Prorocentrum cordatum]
TPISSTNTFEPIYLDLCSGPLDDMEAQTGAAGSADAAMEDVNAFGPPKWAGKRSGTEGEDSAAKQHKGAGKGAKLRDDDWRAMALCTARLTLAVARDTASLAATVYETWELNADAPLPAAGILAGQEYNEQAKELHEQHEKDASVDLAQLGPPHLVVSAKVFQELAKHVSEQGKPTLAQFSATVVQAEAPTPLGEAVPHLSVKKNKQKSAKGVQKCRIVVAMATDPHIRTIRDMLVEEIQKEGGQKKLGPAPRGALERELNRVVSRA